MLETIKAIQELVFEQEQKGIIITDIKIDVKKSTVIESVGVTIVCEDAPYPRVIIATEIEECRNNISEVKKRATL